jgi:hypothetical protein
MDLVCQAIFAGRPNALHFAASKAFAIKQKRSKTDCAFELPGIGVSILEWLNTTVFLVESRSK